jgi:nicotinamidase-related amidase
MLMSSSMPTSTFTLDWRLTDIHDIFSCFSDAHGNPQRLLPPGSATHDMQTELEKRDISHIFVLGLGGDHCVAETARDGKKLGFTSHVVEDCLAFHDATENDWATVKPDLLAHGIKLVRSDGPEIELLRHS